jgi:phosphoesterase RecJ-like protein
VRDVSLNKTLSPTADAISAICRAITSHRRFLICGHVRPDGDCLGSQLGTYHILTALGKEAHLYNAGPILEHYQFLPGLERIRPTLEQTYRPEVSIFVDCGAINRVAEDFQPEGIIINIDHHYSNLGFGDINYIDETASAVGEQIFQVAKHLSMKLTPDIATCLYLAILADTGSFRYPNTSDQTLEVAAELVRCGAAPHLIAREYYENRKPESVKLANKVMANLHFAYDGQLVWSEITQQMYESAGGEENEPEGLVSELRSIKGVQVAILFHELPEGGLRAGLRSKGTVDVSRVAKEFNGGGHPNASGIYIRGDYDRLKTQILEAMAADFAAS